MAKRLRLKAIGSHWYVPVRASQSRTTWFWEALETRAPTHDTQSKIIVSFMTSDIFQKIPVDNGIILVTTMI